MDNKTMSLIKDLEQQIWNSSGQFKRKLKRKLMALIEKTKSDDLEMKKKKIGTIHEEQETN